MCLSSSISFITFMFFYFFWSLLESHFKIFGVFIYLLQITSYTYTFLKNPGIPENKKYNEVQDIELNKINENNRKRNNGLQFCNRCHLFVNINNNVSHCEDCNVCIEGNYNNNVFNF